MQRFQKNTQSLVTIQINNLLSQTHNALFLLSENIKNLTWKNLRFKYLYLPEFSTIFSNILEEELHNKILIEEDFEYNDLYSNDMKGN